MVADGSLVLTTLVWGATFVVVKDMVARVDAIALVAVRFLMAAVIIGVAVAPRFRRMTLRLAGAGVLVGLALFVGYAFQTLGLEYTSASKAGFITGLSVVLVPILSTLILKKPPEPAAIAGVGCAVVGLGLLTPTSKRGPPPRSAISWSWSGPWRSGFTSSRWASSPRSSTCPCL